MADFELTDYGIEALISVPLSGVAIVVPATVPNYGTLLAFLFGLGLMTSSALALSGIWSERSERPLFWAIMLMFGIVFEFGAVTDIVAILPYCVLIDAFVLVASVIVTAVMPIISAVMEHSTSITMKRMMAARLGN